MVLLLLGSQRSQKQESSAFYVLGLAFENIGLVLCSIRLMERAKIVPTGPYSKCLHFSSFILLCLLLLAGLVHFSL